MKWFEVVSGSDGYYSPCRFKTLHEAQKYIDIVEQECDELLISEGPYEVDTEASDFWGE